MKAIDALSLLPDGYRERAIKNYMDADLQNSDVVSLRTAIIKMTDWRNTPEGYDFWTAVCDWARGLNALPPFPKEDKPTSKPVLITIDGLTYRGTIIMDEEV